jgi:hypothetical protein
MLAKAFLFNYPADKVVVLLVALTLLHMELRLVHVVR